MRFVKGTTATAPVELTGEDLSFVDGGISEMDVKGQLGNKKYESFKNEHPIDEGMDRDDYAKKIEKEGAGTRYEADRYWDLQKQTTPDKYGET